MKKLLCIVSGFVILVSALAQANAANCARAAKQLAASRGAQVLAATPVSSGGQTICQIKLLIPGKNGKPPRVETMRVNG
ncbi:MAG: hypothetical protein AAF362_03355 [Pseudomonadota bacterium]